MHRTGLTLAASLAMHGLLAGCISALTALFPPAPPALRLDFTLLEQVTEPEDASLQNTQPETQPAVKPSPARRSVPAPLPAQKTIATTPVTKVRPRPVQKSVEAVATPAAATSERADAVPSATTMAEVASPSASNGAKEADTVEAYRHANFSTIRSTILANLRYPMIARRHGWSGKVEIAFLVTPEGRVGQLRVQRSSGHEVLDEEAMAAIRRSAPFVPPRIAALLVMPVTFELN